MKTTYSLMEFFDSVQDIAKAVGEDYVSISINCGHDRTIEFKAYIPKAGWHTSATIDDCLEKLKKAVGIGVPKKIDVEIEMDEPVNLSVPETEEDYNTALHEAKHEIK